MMKKVITYVNSARVHNLIEELGKVGILQMVVTEYFTPNSQISRFIFLCHEEIVALTREIVRRVGTSGDPSDHFFEVQDFDPQHPGTFLYGQRIHILE
jgi:hypothetical protein